ncbi:unnamed protein product [Macrosiphum euphorbiae]|uniref:C2H2-type domain-containing protein n=1 Tax=Macrosiphum euphorbiae TaxID=13131 RepID=A0AAV0X543_9HEMI|nr:unnamed protein product [Macrosiphum euphorbiae]
MNFGNKNETNSGKRKRIKLECLECGKTFDNDYKQKHEKNIHNGKKVGTKHFGAPKNPFEASKPNSKQVSKNP